MIAGRVVGERRASPAPMSALGQKQTFAAQSASEAPRIRRSRASRSPCRRGKSFVPALSLSLARTRKAIKSSGPILATSPSSGTAKRPPPPARRVRRFMSVLRLARLRVWQSSSTARSRPSTSVGSKPDKKLLHLYATRRMPGYMFSPARI
jgi:hypothetical protein